jgi:hypothetical protein
LMAGVSGAHDRLSRNMAHAIEINFLSGPCHVSGSDLKVLVGLSNQMAKKTASIPM